MNYYVADFETTTKEENCHVWAWAVCKVGDNSIQIGTTLDEFMSWCRNQEDNPTVYFHNLLYTML